jgi:aspartate aminotransferase-like enzyme
MDLALKRMNRGGMPAYWKARKALADGVRRRVAALGLSLFPQNPSNALTVIKMPEGVDGAKVVDLCKTRYKVLLANGQGDMRGRIVRIGHMGPVTKPEMTKVFGCFQRALKQVSRRAK